MKQYSVLLQKEWREAWRSYKLIWIPLVFLSLGVSDPLVNYFMDDILATVGNMPEGYEMMMPELAPPDLIVASTGQFQSIGLIVLIAVFVGAISRERQNGTATLLYVRPLSFSALFFSKLTIAFIVGAVSMLLGYMGSAYYTTLLYGGLEWSKFVLMLATYALWILFVCAFTLAMSAIFSTAIAATISIIVIPIGLLIDSLIGGFWTMTPWKLSTYGIQLLRGDVDYDHFIWTVIITTALTSVFIVMGIIGCQKNADKVKS